NPDFCARCARVMIPSDGRFNPGRLGAENTVDLPGPMRSGANDEELEQIYLRAVSLRKPYFGWVIPVAEEGGVVAGR
ncbi:MAG: hypothetical protein DRO01_02030, partial [Thermoproteota archaeon]